MKIGEFNLRLEQPWSSEHFLPPEDPLGELTQFEMGLRRFCFERNQRVALDLGAESKHVFLFPDICLLIDRLPEKISSLRRGNKIELEFPESFMIIEIAPESGKAICVLRKFGNTPESKSLEFELDNVITALDWFVHLVIQLAIDSGYITKEDAEDFLRTS